MKMVLTFGGYGGEYCCGKLNKLHINNIKELLRRFDYNEIIGHFDTLFSSSGWERQYYDFDDIEHISSCAIDGSISINVNEYEYSKYDTINISDLTLNINDDNFLSDGWYISSVSIEKGIFFETEILKNTDDFNKDLLVIEAKDTDYIGTGDIVITDIFYNNIPLEMNYDVMDTYGKGFHQSIFYVEDKIQYDGKEKLLGHFKNSFNILEIKGIDREDIIFEYLEYIEAANNGYLIKDDRIIVWASPFLYERFEKEDVDLLWMTEKNIKFALKNDFQSEIPEDVWERIIRRFPEWLI